MKFFTQTLLVLATAALSVAAVKTSSGSTTLRRELKGGKSGTSSEDSCMPGDFEGLWHYTSQGNGVVYALYITCPTDYRCQIADSATAKTDPCNTVGVITEDDVSMVDGKCTLGGDGAVQLNVVGDEIDASCTNERADGALGIRAVKETSNVLLFLFSRSEPLGDVFYNEGTPRQGLRK